MSNQVQDSKLLVFVDEIVAQKQELQPLKPKVLELITPHIHLIQPLIDSIDEQTIQSLKTDVIALCDNAQSQTLDTEFESFLQKYPQITPIIEMVKTNQEVIHLVEQGIELIKQADQSQVKIPSEDQEATQDPQPITPSDELLTKIEEILQQNASWIEHTKLSFVVNSQLYKKFLSLEDSYQKSLKVLMEFEQDTNIMREEVFGVFKDFETKSVDVKEMLDNTLSQAQALTTQSVENANTILESLKDMEILKDDVNTKTIELYALRDNILALQKQLDDLEAIKTQVDDLSVRITALKQDLEEKVKLWEEGIVNRTTTSKSELQTLAQSLKEALNSHKDSLESEITTHKDQSILELQNKISEANERYTALEQSFIDKQNNINQANALITQSKTDLSTQLDTSIATLQTKTHQHIATLQTKVDEHTNTLQTKTQQHTNTLQTKTHEHTNTLQTKTDEHIATLQNAKTQHIQFLTQHQAGLAQTMTSIKDSFLTEIRNDLPAQVATLTQLCNEIKASNQALGTNYISKTYTAGGIFSVVSGVSEYYVFVRGGTGGTNSYATGGTTSFGSLLSATGGAGNPNGAGQLGESRAGFVSFNTNQTMTIPSGGVIIVSYATK